jgi:2-dehydro-3-deoxyphosphogluconate aldolase / (4S)-4-hydroxy-2-oxoglutarate aldolase
MTDATTILERGPVIPVTTVPRAQDAVAIGEALLEGGITVIEVTLRSAAGLPAIEQLRKHCPDLCVGAGTVWTGAQAADAARAGAQFIVSPGAAAGVLAMCAHLALPYLPGGQTVSEMAELTRGTRRAVKFFPAASSGGVETLKAFAAVLPGVLFCPTGGIDAATAPRYLALDCVPCVGGGWITPPGALAARNWRTIRSAAALAGALGAARETGR